MRVLLELEKLKDPYSGLGQFCAHLAHALAAACPPDAALTAYLPADKVGFLGDKVTYKKIGRFDRYVPLLTGCDVWHATHQGAPYWPAPGRAVPVVLTIHDLNFMERTDYGARKKRFKRWQIQQRIDRADALVAISEYTAGQLRQHLRLGRKPLHVIHNGCPPLVSEAQQEALAQVQKPFVLGLGVIHPKKNWSVLLPLIQRLPELTLVLAGDDRHSYADLLRQQAKSLGLENRVLLTGAVSDTQKAWLLRHCEALWFPSLSEGFGIPPIEAMSVGKPVFLSALTSLPEVGGNAAHYWNSFAPDAMAEVFVRGMAEFGRDPSRADILRQRAALFSWETAAAEYWKLYATLS